MGAGLRGLDHSSGQFLMESCDVRAVLRPRWLRVFMLHLLCSSWLQRSS